jgi:hypothetical protein
MYDRPGSRTIRTGGVPDHVGRKKRQVEGETDALHLPRGLHRVPRQLTWS